MKLKQKLSVTAAAIAAAIVFPLSSPHLKTAVAQQKTCVELLKAANVTDADTVAKSFKDSNCIEVKLAKATIFYRHHTNDTDQKGRYLSSNQYTTNVDAIKKLALKQEWGNKALKITSVTLAAGTVTYQGIVAPQDPAACYPGGGQQTFIVNSKDASIQWSTSQNLTVSTFVCP